MQEMVRDTYAEIETSIRLQVERCIDELGQGRLTEQGLHRVTEVLDRAKPRLQQLLYLQADASSLGSSVVGMRIVENGEMSDGPSDPDDWPYQTVLDAVRDGWRIIKFPEMALMLDEERAYGLGCEFILERY